MYKKVLIATDGSATAAHAAEIGIDVAKASGAEALILHVGDPKAGKKVLQQVEKSLAVSKVPLSAMKPRNRSGKRSPKRTALAARPSSFCTRAERRF